jgi:hypothetical protein
LASDITTLSFENLAVIGQDLYVADIDPTTTTLSFPSLGNVSGSITLSSASIETVELSALRVCGSLSVSSGSATNLYFPVLEEVFGAMSFSGSGIRTIELPSLFVVDGSASFTYLYSMSSIAMPAVKTIGGGLSISHWCNVYYADTSGSVDIHSLESMGGTFYIYYLNYVSECFLTINATRLQTLGSLYVDDRGMDYHTIRGGLTQLSMPRLTTIQGGLTIMDADTLTTASFDSLTTIQGNLYMNEVSALTSVAFGSLTTVEGYLYISGGALLATAYFNSLTSVGQTVSCDVSGESENICIRDSAALGIIAFRSLDYDSFDIATPSGAPV